MTFDSFPPAPASCDSWQGQLSDCADAGTRPAPALQAHLASCEDCARFAEQWLPGPPAELVAAPPAGFSQALRDRILDAAPLPGVIPFSFPGADRAAWIAWAGRIAAGLALAGLSYWLLAPLKSPVRKSFVATSTTPGITQSLAQIEDGPKHEQELLQRALVDGGSEVRGKVAWSMSALDL